VTPLLAAKDEPRADFELGYDQGVAEVLDDVRKIDPEVYEAVVRERPEWRRR
jgi:hypothetical protein